MDDSGLKLSIVIVNYNVKYFLLQLLQSIYNSHVSFNFEVIIVDNASSDGSRELLPDQFPQVKYIWNQKNVGFSVANNQAIEQSNAQYVLLLNPDTVVQEDTLQLSIDFMDEHTDAGALGCRMIDGSGHFLPESKRGFPSPRVAFFKAFGFGSMFPKSPFFNAYYMGHLPEDEINKVDVLTGAFMLMRMDVLRKTGFLDERFFMYGEDIDLSFRIKQAGYEIYYFPKTSIIHFKGESTNKETFNYIRTFYGAMKNFARKHYSGQKASLLSLTLNLAIYLRAALSALKTVFARIGLPLIEFVGIWMALYAFSGLWAAYYFSDPGYYYNSFLKTNISIYALIWIASLYALGAYDDRFAIYRMIRGTIVGWLGVAVLYGLLGPQLRPSRTLVVASGLLVAAVIFLVRFLLFKIYRGHGRMFSPGARKYIIVGDGAGANRIQHLVQLNHPSYEYLGFVSGDDVSEDNSRIGHFSQLDQICRFYHVQEIIFSSHGLSSAEIMRWMTKLGQKYHFKMAPDHSMSIIGSRSKNLPGELYTFDMKFQVDDPYQRRNKRFFDLTSSMFLLLFSPLIVWFMKDKRSFMTSVLAVLVGRKTWVSYSSDNANQTFPTLREGVLHPVQVEGLEEDEFRRESDYLYARDYTVWTDVVILVRNFTKIGS